MRPILCVRHQPSAGLGVLAQAFARLGVPVRHADAWRGDPLPEPDGYAAVVVLGGEMNVDDTAAHPFLGDVRRLVHRALERERPMLGICLGAQTLARVLGAHVSPVPRREIGFRPVQATAAGRQDPLLTPFADAGPVFQWHEDTFDLPHGATLLYRGEEVANQAFVYGPCAYGVQFHFEISEAEIAAWCDETDQRDLRTVWDTSRAELLAEAARHVPRQRRAAGEVAVRLLTLAGVGAARD